MALSNGALAKPVTTPIQPGMIFFPPLGIFLRYRIIYFSSSDGCASNCTVELGYNCATTPCKPICGDGLVRGTEVCDDGNTYGGDGCNGTCRIELGWNCTAASPSVCHEVCGNGIITKSEQCRHIF